MTSPRTPKASRRQKVSSKGVLNAVRTERESWAVPPRPALGLLGWIPTPTESKFHYDVRHLVRPQMPPYE
jgi:hypothetical protein